MIAYDSRITYFDKYSEDAKTGNCGYVRTRIRDGIGTLRIELEENELKAANPVQVGYFVWSEDEENKIFACAFCEKNVREGMPWVFEFNPQNMAKLEYNQISGIAVKCDRNLYLADWTKKSGINQINIIEWKNTLKLDKQPPKCDKSGSAESTKINDAKINDWREMFKKYDRVEKFSDDRIFDVVQIGYDDLEYLPCACDGLVNNSFLLHGLFNYGHIILGKYKCKKKHKVYMIGIPGMADTSEKTMAPMFGFEQFKPVKACKNEEANFGYWYRLFTD
jgi:hypothetical protein